VPASSILFLETDQSSGELIANTLTRAGYAVTETDDPSEVAPHAREHNLVVIDTVSGDISALDVCRRLRSINLGTVPILCFSQTDDVEERILFLEAGADDVVAKPFDTRELEARVEALLLRFQRSRVLAPAAPATPSRRSSRLIVCFSPKGGVGTTTIAVNIAVVAGQLHPDRALLVDLDLQFGQIVTQLNLKPSTTMADLVRDDDALMDPELLRGYVTSGDGGLGVIGAPTSPEMARLVQARHVERLLATAGRVYDVIVVDGGSTLDERALALFEQADSIVLPFVAELGGLKALSTLLDYLNETSSTAMKTTYVLNHVFAREFLDRPDIEQALGIKIGLELPYDPIVYGKAANEGMPVVLRAPRSAAAEALSRLATITLGAAAPGPATQGGQRRGITGLVRRT